MSSIISTCNICGNSNYEVIYVSEDKKYNIVRCRHCRLVFCTSVPSKEEIEKIYKTGEIIYKEGTEELNIDGSRKFPEWKEKEIKDCLMKIKKYGFVNKKLLDIGCLWGFFLNVAKACGYDVYGVEPMLEAAEYVKKNVTSNIMAGTLRDAGFQENFFDVVRLGDVIEHLTDPASNLRKIYKIIKHDGLLIIETPNIRGLLPTIRKYYRTILGKTTDPINAPFHLYGFTPYTIRLLLEKEKFKIKEINYKGTMTTVRSENEKNFKWYIQKIVSDIGVILSSGDRMVIYATK